MSTTAVILAADTDSAFPASKYLAKVRGVAVLETVIHDASSWPVDEVVVVLGADSDLVLESVDFGGATVLVDPEWAEGSASPVRAVIDLISRDRAVDRCVMARGNQPGITAETVGALLAAAESADAEAVVPKYRYSRGWPLVVGKPLWEQLLGREGSIDILGSIVAHAGSVEEVWFDHLGPTAYDKPEDLPTHER